MIKRFKKLIHVSMFIILFVAILCFSASAANETGKCGSNVYWDYNTETKELVIKGTGDMYNYGYYSDEYTDDSGRQNPFENMFIESVTIQQGVTNIGRGVFDSCFTLKEVIIGESVTRIEDYAFYCCTGLEKLVFSEGLESIGEGSFHGCSSIVKIELPSSLKIIKLEGFRDCKKLADVTFLSKDLVLGYDCFSLTALMEDKSKWSDGALYIDGYLVKADTNFKGSFTIKDTAVKISEYAFYGCKKITEIIIPDSVKTIGDYAFYNTAFKNIYIPSNVTKIGKNIFENTQLISAEIEDGVKIIENSMFYNCNNLKEIIIPQSVTVIANKAFYCCNNLKDIYYFGTQLQWEDVTFGKDNSCLDNATVYFNYCGSVHKYTVDVAQQNPTCSAVGYTAGKQCSVCKVWLSGHNEIEKLPHAYKATTTKATLTKNGKIENKCSCGDVIKTTTIYYPKTIKLSSSKVTYNGKAYSPTITVKDSKGNALVKDTDYTVTTPNGRKAPGKYTYTIKFKGNYTGTKTLTLTILPTKTSKLTATPKSNEIKLSWEAVEGATGYKVYQYDYTKKKSTALKTLSGTTYTIKNLKANTKYRFSVKAYKIVDGEKLWSDIYTIVETKTCPAVVSKISATQTTTSVKLTWSAVSGAKGYKVYRYVDNKWKEIKNTTGTSYTVSKLKEGSKYKFAVKAYVKNGEKLVYSSSYKTIETATKCKAPSITSVTSPSKSKVTVKWKNVNGETGFQLYYATSKDGTYKKLSTFKGNVTSGTSTLPSAVRGKTVYFKVRDYKTVGDKTVYSAWSNIKSVKIK